MPPVSSNKPSKPVLSVRKPEKPQGKVLKSTSPAITSSVSSTQTYLFLSSKSPSSTSLFFLKLYESLLLPKTLPIKFLLSGSSVKFFQEAITSPTTGSLSNASRDKVNVAQSDAVFPKRKSESKILNLLFATVPSSCAYSLNSFFVCPPNFCDIIQGDFAVLNLVSNPSKLGFSAAATFLSPFEGKQNAALSTVASPPAFVNKPVTSIEATAGEISQCACK